ncbi:hemolysin family protein [Poriferisphaera sp. WC338]|uniref:hemolysin family protein n=1 Tax=Poriferisphaera sp. WC338 TaxID=3425129 RepID=UPI003D81750E
MMSVPDTLMIISLPVLLVLSAFFSGSETALFNLSRLERMQLAQAGGIGTLITKLLSETRQILITLLLGNMTINVLYFAISSALTLQISKKFTDTSTAALASAGISIAALVGVILFGEVFPKQFAVKSSLTSAKLIALPLYMIHRIIAPIRWFAGLFIITPLARLLAPRASAEIAEMTNDELESLLRLSQRRGVIDREEQEILQQVFELGQIKVRDLMIPRVDIVGHDINQSADQLIETIRETRLRHIPLYESHLDNIIGVIDTRIALVKRPTDSNSIRDLMREALFIPEQQRADQLLVAFRDQGRMFAIVVDEYGGTAGLITFEDVIEHMVGDIAGGFKTKTEPEVQQLSPGKYRVSAELPIYDWTEFFGRNELVNRYGALDEVSTIAGLILAILGRLAQEGDQIALGNVSVRVDTVQKNRIEWVTIQLTEPQNSNDKETDHDR